MKTDFEIQKNVMEQLKWEPILDAAEIGVSVKNGIVTLSGQVNSYAKKLAAERAAKKVGGVRQSPKTLRYIFGLINKKQIWKLPRLSSMPLNGMRQSQMRKLRSK